MIYSREDRVICETLLKSAKERKDRLKPFSELVLAAGQHFLDTPYEPDTLEGEGSEELVVNLRAFDCVTFVENAVALAGLIRCGKTSFADFTAALDQIRYRRGRCDGYASRLHYFTDWIYDNGRKGLVRDITREIGGIPFRKTFHCLTDRREDHPGLKDPLAFRRLRIIEGSCSRRPLFFIPKASLERTGDGITDGDIIALTTDERGLDVSHTGLSVRIGGQLHLLHASSAAGKVVLSEITLSRYLQARRSRTGIIVSRAISPDGSRKRQSKTPRALTSPCEETGSAPEEVPLGPHLTTPLLTLPASMHIICAGCSELRGDQTQKGLI